LNLYTAHLMCFGTCTASDVMSMSCNPFVVRQKQLYVQNLNFFFALGAKKIVNLNYPIIHFRSLLPVLYQNYRRIYTCLQNREHCDITMKNGIWQNIQSSSWKSWTKKSFFWSSSKYKNQGRLNCVPFNNHKYQGWFKLFFLFPYIIHF
jgi:hypothetical protein